MTTPYIFHLPGFSPPAPPAPYHAGAVHCDGIFWANIVSLSGIANSPLFTFSAWFQAPDQSHNGRKIFNQDPINAGNYVTLSASSDPHQIITDFEAADFSGGTGNFTDAGVFSYDAWHHLFGYADVGHSVGAMLSTVFIDGVSVGGTPSDYGVSTTLTFNGTEFAFPDNGVLAGGAGLLTVDVADLMVYPGQLITDLTIFRDPITGKPKDPAGFPQGAVMMSGNASTFLLNTLGTAGPLITQAGTLTTAFTSPSD